MTNKIIPLGVLSLVAQVFAQQLSVPAWPLAVKNPYLNTWYQAGSKPAELNEVWPALWDPSATGWYCGVQVDGVPFRLMGQDFTVTANASTQLSVGITPTRTVVQMQAGPVNVTMNFLSPVTVRPITYAEFRSYFIFTQATDLTRQSLPFSYFFFTVASIDGSPHSVNIYSDITAGVLYYSSGSKSTSSRQT